MTRKKLRVTSLLYTKYLETIDSYTKRMSKKKVGKPQTAETKRLSRSVPARLYPQDLERLLNYEKVGLNMSDIIRRCVNRSLEEVVGEIRDGIQQVSEPT